MTLNEIKTAVAAGKTVHWSNDYYTVICDKHNQWMIKGANGHCIGLTWADEVTMNGKEEEFYIAATMPTFFKNDLARKDGSYNISFDDLIKEEAEEIAENEEFADWLYNAEVGNSYTEFNNRTYTRII